MMLWLCSEIKYAHLTNNAKCNFVFKWENGVCHYMRCIFFLQMTMQPFLYEILTITLVSKPNASSMQMQMQKCINMPKIKYFSFFEINDMWKKQKTLQLSDPAAILRQQPSKTTR